VNSNLASASIQNEEFRSQMSHERSYQREGIDETNKLNWDKQIRYLMGDKKANTSKKLPKGSKKEVEGPKQPKAKKTKSKASVAITKTAAPTYSVRTPFCISFYQ